MSIIIVDSWNFVVTIFWDVALEERMLLLEGVNNVSEFCSGPV